MINTQHIAGAGRRDHTASRPNQLDAAAPQPKLGSPGAVSGVELAAALAQLRPRARNVLLYRYGLNGGAAFDVEQTAYLLSLTPAKVEFIEQLALLRLRSLLKAAA